SNNARVRTYIWQGAVKLYGFHPPLEYPDGRKDPFNWIRPLFGYGPETMYVAYNRFYVPELTQVERRNASPDRSHNESWDALIITGAIGFVVYVGLFLGLFTYGFQRLGLIRDEIQKRRFWVWVVLMGVVFSAVLILWRGVAYFGVAFPLGMILGVLGFLGIKLLFGAAQPIEEKDFSEALLVVSLLAAFLAHFVEINFGIAIAATRTYFWVMAAILVSLAWGKGAEIHLREEEVSDPQEKDFKRKRRAEGSEFKRAPRPVPGIRMADVSLGIIVALILVVLGYNFMNATGLGDSALQVLWKSFTEVRKETSFHSNGILILILLSWLGSAFLLVGEDISSEADPGFFVRWLRVLGIGLGLALAYWLLHASLLASIVATPISDVQDILARIRQYEGLLTGFYLCVLGLMGIYAATLSYAATASSPWFARRRSVVLGLLCLVLSLTLIYQRNLRVIQADIAFKLGESFAKPGSWPVSIQVYQHAIELAPREDYYYLFLARSYLEYARQIEDVTQREALFSRAKADLTLAQSLNPLNTDHTANLARLYSQWYLSTSDEKQKEERFLESDRYFAIATSLSPNNARIWGEWAVLLMSNEQTHEKAWPKLTRAYRLDPNYDWIAYLFGEYYRIKSLRVREAEERAKALQMALSNYLKAEALANEPSSKRTYALMAAQVALDEGMTSEAIRALERVLLANPTDPEHWKYAQVLAQLYWQGGQKDQALFYAQEALKWAPPEQQNSIRDLVDRIVRRSE
ncbi:MAG: tetratricopeptide repeat protein, partial [Anaerolineales bacterium]|nr:tetratricopeptide repeat protein [Anaerolineales bacterium]MDW8447631.1 tetratricopeptide repeat protein [Anaerolineales bacterium]